MDIFDYNDILKFYKSRIPLFLLGLNDIANKHRDKIKELLFSASIEYLKNNDELYRLIEDFDYLLFIENKIIFKKIFLIRGLNFNKTILDDVFLMYNDVATKNFFDDQLVGIFISDDNTSEYIGQFIEELDKELTLLINFFQEKIELLKYFEWIKHKTNFLFNEINSFVIRYKAQIKYNLKEFFNQDKRFQAIKIEINQLLYCEPKLKCLPEFNYDISEIKKFLDICYFLLDPDIAAGVSSIFISNNKFLRLQNHAISEIELLIEKVCHD